jgi:hypothetical protein
MSPSSDGSESFVSSSVFSGVFIVVEVYRVRDKGSGDTTMVDGKNFLEAFLNISLRSACFTDPLCSGKKQIFSPETALLTNHIIRTLGIVEVRLKKFFSICDVTNRNASNQK